VSGDRGITVKLKLKSAPLLAAIALLATPSHAATPCDFKGISVGSKMSPAQIMTALGVTKYKMNPARPSWEKTAPIVKKYGLMMEAELENWDLGPFCETNSRCVIPYGVGVGNDNTPVNVQIAIQDGMVTAIDVSFAEVEWDEVMPILDHKYGPNWKIDTHDELITNYETKASTMRSITMKRHIPDGQNEITGDRCQIWVENIDMVFTHHDAFGPYHSVFEIKLISKNF
jgi:hypothetical protein